MKNKVAKEVVISDDFANRMNNYPKFVISNTLQEVSWNNSQLIRGDVLYGVENYRFHYQGIHTADIELLHIDDKHFAFEFKILEKYSC
ncbi:hypothetical protein J6TS1_18250 [Siminovitchia terrae]|uniref:Uncharacterized protein n=1 Tax=Siminovitchia terrae TaxID=1914933 RepID=A0ABQ4KWS1_SIMTE|nr:hypothetical protein J6TS1_18250 [Siminovitchia terrae]